MSSNDSRRSYKGIDRREFLRAGLAVGVAGAVATAAADIRDEMAGAYKPLDPGRKVKIGVVGGGFGSSFFWHLHPNCVVHAVSDLIPERRDLLMNCYQCGLAYESLEKLVQDDEIEAVAVATGQPDHVRHCVAVMNAGKHVWCAVPA